MKYSPSFLAKEMVKFLTAVPCDVIGVWQNRQTQPVIRRIVEVSYNECTVMLIFVYNGKRSTAMSIF